MRDLGEDVSVSMSRDVINEDCVARVLDMVESGREQSRESDAGTDGCRVCRVLRAIPETEAGHRSLLALLVTDLSHYFYLPIMDCSLLDLPPPRTFPSVPTPPTHTAPALWIPIPQ